MKETYVELDQKSLDRLVRALGQLPKKIQDSKIRAILRKEAQPLTQAMRQEVPTYHKTVFRYKSHGVRGKIGRMNGTRDGDGVVYDFYRPGNLKRSIGPIAGKKGKSKDEPTIYVGPRQGANRADDGWYGFFVSRGIVGRKTKAPNMFAQRAYQKTQAQAKDKITKNTKKYIANEAEKLGFLRE